jgi:hypothetical protein
MNNKTNKIAIAKEDTQNTEAQADKILGKIFYSNTAKLMYESSTKLHAAGIMSDAEFAKHEIFCCRPTVEKDANGKD